MFKDAAVHLASASGVVPAALETSLGAHAKALYDQLKALGLEVSCFYMHVCRSLETGVCTLNLPPCGCSPTSTMRCLL
jgi:hypothetical protein